ncbi:efflux RND transporter periplasmic adaptor subunit [Pedobacter alpinus]|uniref:Efflux RND transporter periplasmic adaptor subunit n=1 Tax=Pedobacter alpinus TaxID=1590643 RepID=A0ABW5TST3_9SPHI
MKIKYVIYVLIVLVLGYLIYNRLTSSKNDAAKMGTNSKNAASKETSVNGIIVTTKDFSNAVNVSGTIEANEQVEIRSEIPGLIRSINFNEGTNVNAGSLLLKIEDTELQAQYRQALTKQKLAQETEERAGKLLKSEAISQEEYDNSEAELKSLQAQSQLIKAQLSKTEIRAPFSGRIGLRNVSKGAYVTPTTNIANLVSINPVKVTFSVPEKYSQMIRNNVEVSFTIAGTSRIFKAKIFAQEPAIDVNTRTLIIKALANNSDGYLIPGTFANISLPLQTVKNAILIPSTAVIPILSGKQVYITENGKAKAIKIVSDVRTDKDILVSEGLSKGDTVIVSGIMAIKPESPVKVKLINPAK